MNLEEFSYQFGVNGAENLIAKLNQIETETENLDNAAEHLGNTFQKFFDYSLRSAIPPAFIKMVMDQAMAFSRQADYIDKLSQTSGLASKTIQQFGYALHKFGGDVNTATAQLDRLQTHFEKFKKPIDKGGGLASELAQLAKRYKVDLRGVTDGVDLLKAISVRMEKLSERKKVSLARAFGLDDSTFLMVKDGLKNLEESLYKAQKFVLFDDKEIRQAKEFENTLRDIADNITLISKSFSFGAIPQMQKFANIARTVTDFLSDHPKVVEGIGTAAFGAGAYGIFRLLNFLPTKFLAGAAGILGGGLGLGIINEDIDKIDRNHRDKTIVGVLEKRGYEKTAKYIELIWRAVHDLSHNKSFEGFKNLLDKIGQDTNTESLKKENLEKTSEQTETIWDEYKYAFKTDGIKGLLARSMISGETPEERGENYIKQLEEIDQAGGTFSFLWKKIETIFLEIKKTLSNKDFWTPIFEKVDSLIGYLKGIFLDLIIYLKQKMGIDLSDSDKARLLSKEIKSKEQEQADLAIKQVSQGLTDILLSKGDFSKKKDKVTERAEKAAEVIFDTYGNSGYSKDEIKARLLFQAGKRAFKRQNPQMSKDMNALGDYLKNFGDQAEEVKKNISKYYEAYKIKKQEKGKNSEDILKQTIDISDIMANQVMGKIDFKKFSLLDLITKRSELSSEQIEAILGRFKQKLPQDYIISALEAKQKNSLLYSIPDNKSNSSFSLGAIWDSIKGFFSSIGNGLNSLKPTFYERIKKTNPESELLQKKVEDVSFMEVFIEMIVSELQDVYRNWLSIDKALETMGKILHKADKILQEIVDILESLKMKIKEFSGIFGGLAGAAAGAGLGSKVGGHVGATVLGLLGFLLGKKYGKELTREGTYSWEEYASDTIDEVKEWVNDLLNWGSGKTKEEEKEALKKEIFELEKAKAYTTKKGESKKLKEKIEKKKYELKYLEKALKERSPESMKKGLEKIEKMGEAVNSNTPIMNDNSQTNNVTINQTINMNGQNINKEEVGKAAFNGTQEGANLALLKATTTVAGGNRN